MADEDVLKELRRLGRRSRKLEERMAELVEQLGQEQADGEPTPTPEQRIARGYERVEEAVRSRHPTTQAEERRMRIQESNR